MSVFGTLQFNILTDYREGGGVGGVSCFLLTIVDTYVVQRIKEKICMINRLNGRGQRLIVTGLQVTVLLAENGAVDS